MNNTKKPHTIESLMAKCTEEGDCQLWNGSTTKYGHPVMTFLCENKRTTTNVRRRVAQLMGMKIEGMMVSCSCNNALCISPACIEVISRKQLQLKTMKRERQQSRINTRAKLAKIAQRRSPVMSMALAREIRSSDETGRQIAARIGVSAQIVSRVRTNRSWVDFTNPYLRLKAA